MDFANHDSNMTASGIGFYLTYGNSSEPLTDLLYAHFLAIVRTDIPLNPLSYCQNCCTLHLLRLV